mgnify:CR=1 FL=1
MDRKTYIKLYKDANKISKTIYSCKTIHQLRTTENLCENFRKYYSFFIVPETYNYTQFWELIEYFKITIHDKKQELLDNG